MFNISDDDEFHIQKFKISILPLEQEVEEDYGGKVIVSEELVEVEIDDDDREFIYRFFKQLFTLVMKSLLPKLIKVLQFLQSGSLRVLNKKQKKSLN